MAPELISERRDGVLWLTINRPERRNALNENVQKLLLEGLDAASEDKKVRAIVLTGAGDRAFCAGADLNPGQSFNVDLTQPHTAMGKTLRRIRQLHIPTIARINGACYAGGMGLLAMCDMAVAGPGATFSMPEVKVGMFPAQILVVLQRIVPRRVLTELCITGRVFGVQEALQYGLLNAVHDDLDAGLGQLLAGIVDKSRSVLRRGLYMMRAMEDMDFEQSVSFAESQVPLFSQTSDAKEGRQAFVEKRKPIWSEA